MVEEDVMVALIIETVFIWGFLDLACVGVPEQEFLGLFIWVSVSPDSGGISPVLVR